MLVVGMRAKLYISTQEKKRNEKKKGKSRQRRACTVCACSGLFFSRTRRFQFLRQPGDIFSLSSAVPSFFYIYTYILFYFIFFFFSFLEFLPHPIPSHFFGLSARAAMPSFSFQRYRKQPQCDQYHRGAQH